MAYDSGKGEIFVADTWWSWGSLSMSDTVTVISDSPPLVAPSVLPFSMSVDLGQGVTLSCNQMTTGAPPYRYQWFSEAPNASSYSLIDNATSPNYDFATSKTTVTGNWTFMLQVTDATGAGVNSTATTVAVNTPPPPPNPPHRGLSIIDVISIAVAVIVLGLVALTWIMRKRLLKGPIWKTN
jgi:hypothetical protein